METKFKVGDKVSYCGGNIGIIGCIEGTTAYMSEGHFSGGSPFKPGDGGCCKIHNTCMGFGLTGLKLVESASKPSPKFKLGDRVRVTGNKCGGWDVGFVGTITGAYTDQGRMAWVLDNSCYNLEEELELVEEEVSKNVVDGTGGLYYVSSENTSDWYLKEYPMTIPVTKPSKLKDLNGKYKIYRRK